MLKNTDKNNHKWLLFFYSFPSKPVSSRIKIWRRLAKSGAVQIKGSVYILPHSEDHYEFLQWLISEVISLNGEGTFIVAEKVETMTTSEVINLFNQQRKADYQVVEKDLEELQRKINSIKKGTKAQNIKQLSQQFDKHLRKFEEMRKIDFFSSKAGNDLKKRMKSMEVEIKKTSGSAVETQTKIITRRIEDYQGKKWITRKRPFVDRMASAWLLRKFIDKKATFEFTDEKKKKDRHREGILFDTPGGTFTHISDKCTFEVLIEAFKLKDRALSEIAKIVHELDVKDDKYNIPEARGIESLLIGIRKVEVNDYHALERGIALFEMLYASKT
jgi:hypothetical protein